MIFKIMHKESWRLIYYQTVYITGYEKVLDFIKLVDETFRTIKVTRMHLPDQYVSQKLADKDLCSRLKQSSFFYNTLKENLIN